MAEFTEYKPGTFCWVELVTSDGDGAKSFYGQLFGWTTADHPVSEDTVYTMAQINQKNVAAMYQMNSHQQAQGVAPHWNSYISVASADEVAEKVKTGGGTVITAPFDVFDAGRMAILQDPTGATFSIWQPNQHIGATLANEENTFCWNELVTTDVDKAAEFYTEVFGWSKMTQDMGGMVYTSFMDGKEPRGGMLQIAPEWGEVPPNWMVYFTVANCDDAVAKATSLGAQALVPPTDIPGVGRFATLQDPQGAAFSVIKLENPA